VASEAPSLAATLSPTGRPSGQAWGDPVLRPPAVQLGVTLPSAGHKSYTTATLFSPLPPSQRLLRWKEAHCCVEGEKITPDRAAAAQSGCG